MRATPELVWALRRAAKRILDPAEGYSWSKAESCNCGLLVRELTGLSTSELRQKIWHSPSHMGCWRSTANFGRCKLCGEPMDVVYETLAEVGFEPADFGKIEFFWPPDCNLTQPYKDAREVSKHFMRLADQLEAQLTTNCTKRDEFACIDNDAQAPCAHETNSPTEPAGARANAATNSTGTGQPASVAACATVRTSRPAQTEQGAAQ